MKVLVTGGAGFIGSHIADALAIEHDVAVIDNLATGNTENIGDDIKFYEIDICDPGIDKVFKEFKPDMVYHEAAQANVRKSIDDPAFDARVNVLGSINLLEACRKHSVNKIVYASSGGAVYGEPIDLPVGEGHPTNPLCPYGASKLTVEFYVKLYKLNYGLDYTILRYSNVYGPRQDPLGEAGVIAIFTGRLLKGEKCEIFGDGLQTRDFVYVGDVVNANLKAMEHSGIFNIGSGVESSVNEISDLLVKHCEADSKPVHTDAIDGEVRRIVLDVSNARKGLDWAPRVSLDAGLSETIDWFKNTSRV